MSEIDWSEAKPGYDIHINWGDRSHFYQVVGDRYVREYGYYAVISEVEGMDGVVVTARPPAWSGDGLPPVGAYIEWLSDQYGWLGGRVVGHDGMVTVVSHNDGYTGCHAHEVRPIRTPEQIAAEEREAAVAQMLALDEYDASSQLGMMSRADFCRALYDNNYRKVEQ